DARVRGARGDRARALARPASPANRGGRDRGPRVRGRQRALAGGRVRGSCGWRGGAGLYVARTELCADVGCAVLGESERMETDEKLVLDVMHPGVVTCPP